METIFNNRVINTNHSKAIQTKFRIPITKDNTLTLLIIHIPTLLHQHHNSKATKALTSPMTLTTPFRHKMKYNTQLILQDHPPGDLIILQQGHPNHQEDQPLFQENLILSQMLFCHMENDRNKRFSMKMRCIG